MMVPDTPQPPDALRDLIEVRVAPHSAAAAVRELSWDSDAEVVLLKRVHAVALLRRYLAGELDSSDLEAWADAVEGREDIGEEAGFEELLRAFVFETANPALVEPISDDFARRWLSRMENC